MAAATPAQSKPKTAPKAPRKDNQLHEGVSRKKDKRGQTYVEVKTASGTKRKDYVPE